MPVTVPIHFNIRSPPGAPSTELTCMCVCVCSSLAALDDDGVKKWGMERLTGHRYVALLNRSGRNWPHRSGSSNADSKTNDGRTGVSAGLIQTSVKGPFVHSTCCYTQPLEDGSRSGVKAVISTAHTRSETESCSRSEICGKLRKTAENCLSHKDCDEGRVMDEEETFLTNLYGSVHFYTGV